jgi:hypothetical protein
MNTLWNIVDYDYVDGGFELLASISLVRWKGCHLSSVLSVS